MNLKDLIKLALNEDLPHGDITTDPLNCENISGRAKLIAKQDLVVSGCEPFEMTFNQIDAKVSVQWKIKDGQKLSKLDEAAVIEGPLSSLLKGERTALNFLGHLSGIATLTSKFVAQTAGTKTKIIDTRKTTPLWRDLEKAAVKHGGGENHRRDLSDKVLVKENHIRAMGGLEAAVSKIRGAHPKAFLEVEVTNLDELHRALKLGVQQVLLDNMTNETMAQAVKITSGACLLEASGNMTLDRIQSVAKLGVDFISVGQLTHSAPCADFSLLFDHKS